MKNQLGKCLDIHSAFQIVKDIKFSELLKDNKTNSFKVMLFTNIGIVKGDILMPVNLEDIQETTKEDGAIDQELLQYYVITQFNNITKVQKENYSIENKIDYSSIETEKILLKNVEISSNINNAIYNISNLTLYTEQIIGFSFFN